MSETVLLTNPKFVPLAGQLLREAGYQVEIVPKADISEEELIQQIQNSKASALYVRVEKITRRVIENCPTLKVIAENGIGVDNIDLEAAAERGIKVLNLPMAPAQSVAEHTIAFLMALGRDLIPLHTETKAGHWPAARPSRAVEIAGKKLFILGFGNIGRLVAKKARGLDMQVMAYDPYVSSEDMKQHGVEKIEDYMQGLHEADFVSVHLPLTEQTTGMFGEEQFRAMKPGAYFMSMGRGPIVQEKALVRALSEGWIAAAAIDVYETEPPAADNPLFALENLIVTPHIAGLTVNAMETFARLGVASIIAGLTDGDGYNLANRRQLEALSGR